MWVRNQRTHIFYLIREQQSWSLIFFVQNDFVQNASALFIHQELPISGDAFG